MAKKPNFKLATAVGAVLPDNLSEEAAAYWLDHPEELAKALNTALTTLPQDAHPTFLVTVDYGKNVFDKFPGPGKGKIPVEIHLLKFDRYISSEDAIKEMDLLGYRPATAQELDPLKSLGNRLPDNPIVELGSTWRDPDGNLYVLCLDEDGSDRYLFLSWFEGAWRSGWLFAAVRK